MRVFGPKLYLLNISMMEKKTQKKVGLRDLGVGK